MRLNALIVTTLFIFVSSSSTAVTEDSTSCDLGWRNKVQNYVSSQIQHYTNNQPSELVAKLKTEIIKDIQRNGPERLVTLADFAMRMVCSYQGIPVSDAATDAFEIAYTAFGLQEMGR